MNAKSLIHLTGLLTVTTLMVSLGAGCDAQERADEHTLLAPPPGQYVRQWQERQIAKADADAFIIYLYEWEEGTLLGPMGRRHMSEIVHNVPYWPFPVVIEADLDKPQLNADRRDAVIAYLYEQGVTSPEERVVVQEVLKYRAQAEEFSRR